MHTALRAFAMQEYRRAQNAASAQGKKDDGDGVASGGAAAPSAPTASTHDLGPANDPRVAPALQYRIRLKLMSEELQRTFVQSTLDAETAAFIRGAKLRRYVTGFISDLLHATCLSRTSANALTFRGGMFVLSSENAERLLAGAAEAAARPARDAADGSSVPLRNASVPLPRFGRWCDIGAGDGGVTAKFAHMCDTVIATEASLPMRWRLLGRGFQVTENIDAGAPYDAVSLFNVLDRCDKPWTLLRDMRRWVKPDGTVVMAVVLPWCPFVEDGNKQKRPSEELPMQGGRCGERVPFEQCVQTLVDNVVKPAGFQVLRWTRVPYLCEGSASYQYYALDDVVLVMRPADPSMTSEAITSVADALLSGAVPPMAPAAAPASSAPM
uniref:DREV methyltransferase n=1 Tax=Neobodo designis TaxID=312471 RepID=A0A7S1M891_NEODS|mmetsp:Transcript_3576/g.11178  ORF Transcript_3576/g.11178 Transcript_3576/m.11178 type:complete len:383 (+) Transcript_3576:50-1198(+)